MVSLGVVAVVLGFVLVMGQVMAVHGAGRPGNCCSQPAVPELYASPGRGTRKVSEGFKEMFDRPRARPRPPQRSEGYDHHHDGLVQGWNQLLREVPSGPDPLHHHNGGTRKPETP